MSIRFCFVFILFWLGAAASKASSIDGQKVSFARLMEELTNGVSDPQNEKTVGYPVAYYAKKDFIVIRDVEIVFDREKDNDLDLRFANGGAAVTVLKGVEFHHCRFPASFWYLLRNVVFEDVVGFRQCSSMQGIFSECVFKHHFYLTECQIEFFEFKGCRFDYGIDITGNTKVRDHLSFEGCTFSMDPVLANTARVHEEVNVIKNLKPIPSYFELINRVDPYDLNFENCKFNLDASIKNPERFKVELSHSQFNSFHFTHCVLQPVVNFSFTSVANQLSLYECNFKGKVLAEAFNFNTSNAMIEWESLAGNKIAVYDPVQKIYLHGGNLDHIKRSLEFNTLISTYALFYASYRQQGNRISANACYREWKDVETAYLAYLTKTDPDFQLYFNWLMNVFLKTFCDYGTNPVKSMIWSFYVMLGFALFYFFFPKQSGLKNAVTFRQRMYNFGKWFTEDRNLAEIFRENREHLEAEEKEIKDFRVFIVENKKTLPWYYRLFGRQMLGGGMMAIKLKERIYNGFDALLGTWRYKGMAKRFFASLGIGLMLFIIILMDVTLRLMDALTTSLNAFSTLGFGEIPVRGAARYLAVLEGFIGWFLLSIFSVSLISQIIQ